MKLQKGILPPLPVSDFDEGIMQLSPALHYFIPLWFKFFFLELYYLTSSVFVLALW